MKYILIPVKDLNCAKQRLAGLMSRRERTVLAWLMLEHVFGEVHKARGYDRVCVVTLYEPAAQLAKRLGFDVILENDQVGESVSVDRGSRLARENGARSVLRLPIDLPLVTSDDIEVLVRKMPDRSDEKFALMVPSRDETGTNALSRTPPDLFPSHFGPNSLMLHAQEAKSCSARSEIIRLPRIACDVDDASDIAHLLSCGGSGSIYDYLTDLQIERRLHFRTAAGG